MFAKRKELKKLGPKHMYMYLFSTDTILLVQLIINYILFGWPDYDLTLMSVYVCKIYWFICSSSSPISPYLIAYISVERFVALKYPSKKSIMRGKRNQLIYLALIIVCNCLLYSPITIFYDISSDIGMNLTDAVNRVILPFILMIVFSAMLIFKIVRSSQRMTQNLSTTNQNKRLKRNIKISISLIFINIFYIVLTLPVSITDYSSFLSLDFFLTLYIGYMSYGINFYLILFKNSLISDEFLKMVKKTFSC
jgi:hypothetical protein